MKATRIVAVLSGVPLLALLAFGLTRDPRLVPSELTAHPAPPFELAEVDGPRLRLSDLRGQVVLVNFWASWCDACVSENVLFRKAEERWRDKGLKIVGIVYEDDAASAREWMKKQSVDWPGLIDPSSHTAIDYGLFGVPETFFIDRSGRVAYKQTGPVTAEVLERWIPKLLDGTP
jgi:cytochrome c biogenesis protein CcmG, thiol:disulfide interchange protein DsbE